MDDMDDIFFQVEKVCEFTQKFCDQTACTTRIFGWNWNCHTIFWPDNKKIAPLWTEGVKFMIICWGAIPWSKNMLSIRMDYLIYKHGRSATAGCCNWIKMHDPKYSCSLETCWRNRIFTCMVTQTRQYLQRSVFVGVSSSSTMLRLVKIILNRCQPSF